MIWHKDIGFRPVEEKDLEELRKLRNDPTTWAYLSDANQINPVEQREWFERISKSSTTAYFSVVKVEREPVAPISIEQFIGVIRIDEYDANNRSVRVGCDIIPGERGNGYGTMVFESILKYWFDNLGMHRIWLCVLENNAVAKKLYENVGFREEGRMREAIWRDGKYHDYIVMSILVGEYKKPKKEQHYVVDDPIIIHKAECKIILDKYNQAKADNDFWKGRAPDYDKLDWVKDEGYLKKFIEVGEFEDFDYVLDVGTGTGVVAFAIEPLVMHVTGIDISVDMLPKTKDCNLFIQEDIRISSTRNEYNKVTARKVFHHITSGTQLAMDKCFQALKPGGKMILSEAVFPEDGPIDEYEKILRVKEPDRIVFTGGLLISLMDNAGFRSIKSYPYTIKNFSVFNWIENSGLSDGDKGKMYMLHINASDELKKSRNMRFTDGDIQMDANHIILVGEKPCT